MIQSWPCTQKTLLGNCNLLFSYNFEQIKLSQTGWNIWHTPLDRGGPVENVESLWFLDSSAPLSPPNATSSLLLPVLFKEHTALISFSAGGSKSWNFHTARLVSKLLPSNKVAWQKNSSAIMEVSGKSCLLLPLLLFKEHDDGPTFISEQSADPSPSRFCPNKSSFLQHRRWNNGSRTLTRE